MAALQRGYHCMLFDGPGQGSALIRDGLRMRADWEGVIKAVVDAVSELPLVDPDRIALYGWGLGGYLAPRAASVERRLTACIADPGLYSMKRASVPSQTRLGAGQIQADDLISVDDALIDSTSRVIEENRMLRWSLVQRGYWVHGVDNLRDYFRAVMPFTMKDSVQDIRCHTLMTRAQEDPLADGTEAFFASLRCEKTLLRFSSADGRATIARWEIAFC